MKAFIIAIFKKLFKYEKRGIEKKFTLGITLLSVFFLIVCFSPEDYERIANEITEKTATKLEEEKDLRLVGTGGRMMDDIKEMDMGFYYYHLVDIETARELMVYVIDEYLSEINASTRIRPYLHNFPFTAKNVEIAIFVLTPDRRSPPKDKIHCVDSTNGVIHYYVDGETEYSRRAICEETYEEAKLVLSKKKI